jgi:flagellar basal-body rod protein FlgF
MDRLIYTAMSGANAAAHRQAVLSNNLANATTNGFRAELSAYRAVPVRGEGTPTRVFSIEATAGYSDAAGPAQRTGRDLDAMSGGNQWFAVQGLDGTEAYTRNGAFEISPEGNLVTGNGLTVLSDGGAPIAMPPGATVSLGFDGTISAKVGNQPASTVGRLKVATAEGPLKRGDDGLFRTANGDPLPNNPTARIQVGVLEGSNVNTVETMVGIIQSAREFEVQMRLLQTAETNDRSAAQLLGLQG